MSSVCTPSRAKLCFVSGVDTSTHVVAAARLGRMLNGIVCKKLFAFRSISGTSDRGCRHGNSVEGMDSMPPIGPQMLGTPWPQITAG